MLRCREIRQWRWQGVAVVCAAAMVASCGVAGGEGGSSRSTAVAGGSPLQSARSPASSPVLGYQLNGVASASAATAWAAGTSNQNTLHLVRWDGRTWQRVPTPGGGYFNGVAAISGGDAWAVGAGPGNKALIEHWNGTGWTRVTAPSTGGAAILHAVAAVSPDDVSAAGGTNFTGKTVIVHWNGTAWRLGGRRHIYQDGQDSVDRALERRRLAAGAQPDPPGRGSAHGCRRYLGQ